MRIQEVYKQALNDILNSKSKDVADLRKIALKAFTQPIKDIADLQPLNWMQYSDSDWEWYLKVNGVGVAVLTNENLHEPNGGKWVLHDYDDQFSEIYGGGSMPEFDTIEEGKKYVEMRFLLWLKDASDILLSSEPKDERSVATDDAQRTEHENDTIKYWQDVRNEIEKL